MAKIGFSEPTLFSYNGNMKKDWFVGFRMTDNTSGVRKPFQIRMGMNYEKVKSERLTYGRELESTLKEALQNGWNPFTTDIKNFSVEQAVIEAKPDINKMTFDKALDFCMEKGAWAKKTHNGFANVCTYYKNAAIKLDLLEMDVKLITRQHVVQMSNQSKEDRGYSNNSFNKYIGYLGCVMKVLVDWQIIEDNPTHRIALKTVVETNMYESYTEAEKEAIAAYLIKNHYNYYIYLMVIYHTGIRPKEVLSLKIKDVNLNAQEIIIKPDLELENSKTKKIRVVPVNNHLLALLKGMNLESYSKDSFVFGSPFESGKGNKGRAVDGSYGSNHPDFLRPSFVQIRRDTVTKLWNRLIIKKLGIKKYQYAAKHTGGDDKIHAGVELDALKDMYGHSSKRMTEKYVKALKQINKKNIIDKSPSF